MRKGIVLAGGLGTRLHPITLTISKQILPIFDKPMVYYPISNLIMSGIKDILIISTPEHINIFKKLLGSGKQFGIRLRYKIQYKPKGIAEALILGEEFLNGKDACLILGDNIFFGHDLENKLIYASTSKDQRIFVKKVKNPARYGVLNFNKKTPINIIEKPKKFISNYAVTGIYFFNNETIKIAKKLKPSKRNELEITDLNNILLNQKKLKVEKFSNDINWFDAGSHIDYYNSICHVKRFQDQNKTLVGSIELESYKKGFLKKFKIKKLLFKNSEYFKKLNKMIKYY